MFDEDRFRILLDDYFDEMLVGDERLRFEEMIRTTARARELFWEAARQHAQAREWGLAQGGARLAKFLQDAAEPRKGPAKWWIRVMAAAAGTAAAAAVLALVLRSPAPQSHAPAAPLAAVAPAQPVPIALLALSSEAKWATPPPPGLGSALGPGTLHLSEGDVRIDFYSGARVWVRGPAEISLVSEMEMGLASGVISAEVPPVATGFRILSPDFTIREIDTSFGVSVRGQATELHVFQGEVDVTSARVEGKSARLEAGAAIRSTAAGWVNVPLDAGLFPDGEAIIESLTGERESRYWDWQKSTETFTRQPRMLVHYLFNREADDGLIRNIVPGAPRMTHGAAIGGEWTAGRWPQKSALSFSGPSDRIRLAVPGHHRTLTFLAWMRLDTLPRELSSILRVEALAPGTLRWGIDEQGRLRMGVYTLEKNIVSPIDGKLGEWDLAMSPPLMGSEIGYWSHLAAVYDADRKVIELWLNGTRVARRDLKYDFSANLGICQIGSSVVDDAGRSGSRTLRGRMDEMAIVARAFTPAQIREHYRQGRPRNAKNMADPLDW